MPDALTNVCFRGNSGHLSSYRTDRFSLFGRASCTSVIIGLFRRRLRHLTGQDTKIGHFLHAEIYPSVRDPLRDEIKDRRQVRAMCQSARDLDCDNLLWREFCRPIEVETGNAGLIVVGHCQLAADQKDHKVVICAVETNIF
jgi:hypothetical protein